MKTRVLFSSLLTVIFLVAFSGCNIIKNTVAKSGFAGWEITSSDSNFSDNTDETVLNDNAVYYNPGNSDGNIKYINQENTNDNIDFSTNGAEGENSIYNDEDVLNDNPNSEGDVENLETFESSLSTDGNFVDITQDEIDPDNNISNETVNCDEDVYTSVIWIPSSNYVYSGWNPYSNGRWVWSSYGWTWKSNYRWGWATYHYGRWWYSKRYGWVWSPGRRWAPAWVVWGHHKDYEGWYPISPRIKVQRRGVLSTVMPQFNQNGWTIVKKNDFTKTVNNSIMVSDAKKKDIIKNSTIGITLKQDGKRLFNEGPDINKKVTVQNTVMTKKSDVRVTTQQRPKINVNNDVTKNKQNSNNVNKNVKIENNSRATETQRKVSESLTPITKQNNSVKVNKNSTVEKNTPVNNNWEKTNKTVTTTPVIKQNNSVNVNKSNSTENKTVVRDIQKKTIESQPIQVEKNRNTNNTKTNNTISNTKTENTYKTIEKSINNIKTDNSNKTVITVPKVIESPKINKEPVINTQQKSNNKKDDK